MSLPLMLSPLQQRRAAQALLVIAALMAADVVYQLAMHATWRRWISRQARTLHATSMPSTQPVKEKSGRPPELAAELRKRNIFTAPRPTGHGLTLTGVIGDRALFATREGGTVSIKEGESGNAVRVKAINGYDVTIEYEGKPETLHLAVGSGPPGAAAMASPGDVVVTPGGRPTEIRMEVSPGGGPREMDLSKLPPEIREKIEQSRSRRRAK